MASTRELLDRKGLLEARIALSDPDRSKDRERWEEELADIHRQLGSLGAERLPYSDEP